MKYAIDTDTNKLISADAFKFNSTYKNSFACPMCGDVCFFASCTGKYNYFRHADSKHLMCPQHTYYKHLKNVRIIC
jgi:hypothetical protein